jgi:hypothetical protein
LTVEQLTNRHLDLIREFRLREQESFGIPVRRRFSWNYAKHINYYFERNGSTVAGSSSCGQWSLSTIMFCDAESSKVKVRSSIRTSSREYGWNYVKSLNPLKRMV